jgi:hypothetical protein
MRCGGALSAVIAILAIALCASTASSAAAPHHDCGNPPNWSGRLTAVGVGCQKARAVFEDIHCSDTPCTEIQSGAWSCYRRTISRVKARGNCSLGSRRIRWVVYE